MASVPAAIPDHEGAAVAADRTGEAALVSAARAGDEAAFNELISCYYTPLLRYFRAQTNDAGRAEELTQETFMRAFRHLRGLTRESSFKAWLYTIASNELKAELRRAQVLRFVSFEWFTERLGNINSTDRAVDATQACHERDHLQRVYDELSPVLRQALLFHVEEGFTALEVAEILGITRSAAERRISRAKIEFRRHYLALGGGLNHETM